VDIAPYSSLGINSSNVIVAKNFVVKSLVVENKIETQNISQTTTLVWKDANGVIQSRQFVSMVGIHRRTLQ
jgi:gamma-glutamylcysteine synthetase